MIPRYEQDEITQIWSDEHKLQLWQKTELAVVKARANLGMLDKAVATEMKEMLENHPIDIEWWRKRDREVRHDLNAFIDERVRHLPLNLQQHFHDGLTSYDTEEPAFVAMIGKSVRILRTNLFFLTQRLTNLAVQHRFTIMNGRTHGQEAELQSFGKRCLTWLAALRFDIELMNFCEANHLRRSKLSGAIGNYRGLDPNVEKEALAILELEPFYGATQIIPREVYTPTAQVVCQIVHTLAKIALDIRLGARSGKPIYHEPFGKKQKGSSAMPHKKNTIGTEQIEGMARMAEGFFLSIQRNIQTWEERAIEQSCVERIAWPDLFHVALHSVRSMTKILEGLKVYPDNMLREIVETRGCYAAGEAKEFLRRKGAAHGLSSEDAYRIVQLAAFNAHEPSPEERWLRENDLNSLRGAEQALSRMSSATFNRRDSIMMTIPSRNLHPSPELEVTEDDITRWDEILQSIFTDTNWSEWNGIFSPEYLLRNESVLFDLILGEKMT